MRTALLLACIVSACGAPPENEQPIEEADAGEPIDAGERDDIESQFDGGEVPEDVPEDGGEIIEEQDAGTPRCIEYTTRHLQASMQKSDTVAEMNLAIDRSFANTDGIAPDTISWTEIENLSQVNRIDARTGWDTYWPKGKVVHPANYVPISWRTAVYEFVSGTYEKSSDGRSGVTPDLYVTRVRLRHRASGTQVMRVAIHAVAGIDTLNDNVPYRVATHAKNITSFNDMMKGATLPVIGSGDFNTTRLATMLKAENNNVQPYLFDVPSSGGSLGNRLIDWVVHRKVDDKQYVFQAASFVNLAPTDHRGVRAAFKYRPAPCQ